MNNWPVKEDYFYRTDGLLKRIKLDGVLYLEAYENYVKFHSAGQMDIVRARLESVVRQLPDRKFVQISRRFAVAVKHVDTISRDFITFVAAPGLELPFSKRYIGELLVKLNIIEPTSLDSMDPMDPYDKYKGTPGIISPDDDSTPN